MYQIKDNMLILRQVLAQLLLIVFGIYFWFHMQSFREGNILSEFFDIVSIVLPIIILGLISYVFLIFKNYTKGIIIYRDTHKIEYPTLFKRKTANIYDFDNMRPSGPFGGIYTIHMTGTSFPIILKVSSMLIFDEIGSKIRTIKCIK